MKSDWIKLKGRWPGEHRVAHVVRVSSIVNVSDDADDTNRAIVWLGFGGGLIYVDESRDEVMRKIVEGDG